MRQRAAWQGRRARRGFSLIEMLVVLSMLAIFAAMAIPRSRTSRYRADAAAMLTRTLLQEAQRNAITRQSNVIVSFDTTYNRLRIIEDYNNNDTVNTTDRVTYRALEEGARFATPPMGRVSGAAAAASVSGAALRSVSGQPGVIYRRDGSASTDLDLYVTVRQNVNEEYRALVVAPATGRVDIYRWAGASWVRSTQ